MGTKLSTLASKAMDAANNREVTQFINDWVNWSIQEIWMDRLWDFRVRELSGITIAALDYKTNVLPATFGRIKELRITGPINARRLKRITDEILRLRVMDPTAVINGGIPSFWIDPIQEVATISAQASRVIRVWPPADIQYNVGGSHWANHEDLQSNDFCLIPSRCDKVIISRAIIYIKEHEEEVETGPWERKFERQLAKMRNEERRHTDALPGWKPEKYLRQIENRLNSVGNDVDLD